MPANESERLEFLRQGFTSLIVTAPRVEYTALVTAVLPYLRTSASIALYSPSLQPLVDCYTFLKASHQFVAVSVAESWWREQQVLPSRTHPMMSMPGTGGYVLTATRVSKPTAYRGDGNKRGGGHTGSARPPKRARH
jgi:tRNA (adenine-N(1)-)-methyltransferase non-catalytic subunit